MSCHDSCPYKSQMRFTSNMESANIGFRICRQALCTEVPPDICSAVRSRLQSLGSSGTTCRTFAHHQIFRGSHPRSHALLLHRDPLRALDPGPGLDAREFPALQLHDAHGVLGAVPAGLLARVHALLVRSRCL